MARPRSQAPRPFFDRRSFTAADFRPLASTASRPAVPPPVALPAAPVPAPPHPAPVAAPAASYQVPPGYMLVPIGAAPPPAPAHAAPAPAPAAVSPEIVRCAAILNSPEADGREALARQLALETNISAAEAIARLAAAHRGPSPVIASGAAGAAIARQAMGLPADPAADLAVAEGVAAALAGPVAVEASASARFAEDMAEGERTARALLGR